MNVETGKSSSLSPFSLLGLPLQLPRRGNHTEKENVSLLPICTCKQKANHAASLCILRQSNKPTATRMPGLPARGWPACLPAGRQDEGYVARDAGIAALPNNPVGLLRLPQTTRERRRRVCCPRPGPADLGFPFLPFARPAGAAPGSCPGLPPSPAARLQAAPARSGAEAPGGSAVPAGGAAVPRGTPPPTPSSRPRG